MSHPEIPAILYSCYHKVSRQGENFVPQHTISYQLAGSFVLTNGTETYTAEAGSLHLIRKNQLVKFTKCPPDYGDFESLNIYLNDDRLRMFAQEYHFLADHHLATTPLLAIEPTALLQQYFASIQVMMTTHNLHNQPLVDLKIKELLLIVLEANPVLKDILFDFSNPQKIDLEAFMNQNYQFNVSLDRFAYLTGRSLATFKRDFAKLFNTTPHQWILQKRLHEAYYLIKEKGQTASNIYLDLGFEDLSHFSYAFKKQFGLNSTEVRS